MVLRARAARWFELLTAREELAGVLRCLAATGAVELESHTDVSAAHVLPQLRAALDEYRRLAQRYAQYWPAPVDANARPKQHRAPEQLADAALRQLRAWAATAEPLVERLRQQAMRDDHAHRIVLDLFPQRVEPRAEAGDLRHYRPRLSPILRVARGERHSH